MRPRPQNLRQRTYSGFETAWDQACGIWEAVRFGHSSFFAFWDNFLRNHLTLSCLSFLAPQFQTGFRARHVRHKIEDRHGHAADEQ